VGGRGARSRVLVVEDDPRNREVTEEFLRDEHDVVGATGAADAYHILATQSIDLVLLDVMMPEIDGFTACREIKRLYNEPFLPVLLLTALGHQEQRNVGFESGADDFLSKPIDRRELQLRVRAFLRLRQQDDLIRRQLAEVRHLNRLKDDLSALIVHDLRNPLSGIAGFLHVLGRGATDEQRKMLEWAKLAAQNLQDTVEDLLKIRMIEDSRLQLSMHRFSLRRLVEQAADSVRGDAELRNLNLQIVGDNIEADGDETLLRRAVENLLANALRYTRAGTGVDVTLHRSANEVAIDVADRGPGVPAELKHVLFTKYGSVEVASGNAPRGNGLGLYLVRLTAEAHNGEVTAIDRPGGGTIFRICLPAPPPPS